MARLKVDRVGQRFGRLLVVAEAERRGRQAWWHCRCDCGAEKEINGGNLTSGSTISCGCYRRNDKPTSFPKDRTGIRYGKLVALRSVGKREGSPDYFWLCRCDCGVEVEVRGASLSKGDAVSCGNHKAEFAHRAHGQSKTPEYRAWRGMIERCHSPNSPNYPDYGGRGITVCDDWRNDLDTFLADVGKRPSKGHSLDRIDVDGNYEKSNVRWSTTQEQMANRRPPMTHRLYNAVALQLGQALLDIADRDRRIAELEAEIERLRNP